MLLQDILFAAVLAFILLWPILAVSRIVKVIFTRSTEIGYNHHDLETVIEHCCNLFPVDILRFDGAIFQRGMVVQVTTNKHRTIEGQFIGTNDDNMVCFVTPSSVIAHKLVNIEQMRMIGEGK